MRNTAGTPSAATRSPPAAGPTTNPTLRPNEIVPFAQAGSDSSTRFGIAASAAELKGDDEGAARNASTSKEAGDRADASAATHAAPARSEATITMRRSNRSPSDPASGVATASVPKEHRSAPDTHAAEPVRW